MRASALDASIVNRTEIATVARRKTRRDETKNFYTHPKSAWAMSRTLYSRPAEDVSTTHMEELMVNVGQITLLCRACG